MLFVVECTSLRDEFRLVEYRLFSTIKKANNFLIWKAKDVGSIDLNLESGTFTWKGHWGHLRWTRKEIHPE